MMGDIEIYLVIQSDCSLGCRPLPAIVIPMELRSAEAVLIEVCGTASRGMRAARW